MSHSIIIGQTESGKTTLAKLLAAQYKAAGVGVIVFDAAHNDWQCDYQTANPVEFMETAIHSRSCALFVDEAGKAVAWHNKGLVDVAAMFRHFGHFGHFIAQRPAMIAPSVRYNCKRMILFNVSAHDAKELNKEFSRPEILEAPNLKQGEYMIISRFDEPIRGNVFDEINGVSGVDSAEN